MTNYIKCSEESPKPLEPLSIVGMEGYETFIIDDNKIGVRPKWIKCSEQMPPKNIDILVYYLNKYIRIVQYWGSDPVTQEHLFFRLPIPDSCNKYVTHWMPLPPIDSIVDK